MPPLNTMLNHVSPEFIGVITAGDIGQTLGLPLGTHHTRRPEHIV
jgi:hypothetical protein